MRVVEAGVGGEVVELAMSASSGETPDGLYAETLFCGESVRPGRGGTGRFARTLPPRGRLVLSPPGAAGGGVDGGSPGGGGGGAEGGPEMEEAEEEDVVAAGVIAALEEAVNEAVLMAILTVPGRGFAGPAETVERDPPAFVAIVVGRGLNEEAVEGVSVEAELLDFTGKGGSF
jgi:hypothetical protein